MRPFVKQHDEKDCGAACLSMISQYYGLKLPLAKFRELIKVDNQGANMFGITEGAKHIGFDSDALKGSFDDLVEGIVSGEIPLPFIARIINDDFFEHYIVVYKITSKYVIVGDPGKSRITKVHIENFKEQWQQQIITFIPNQSFKPRNECKGSFRKFFKLITQQKKMLTAIVVSSLIITFINMFGSVMFQYVLGSSEMTVAEKSVVANYEEHEHTKECLDDHEEEQAVDNSHSGKFNQLIQVGTEKLAIVFANLNTISIAIICLYLFKCGLNILRNYLLAVTGKRVDIPLTTECYDHMVELPYNFFGTRKTGELMSRFYDAENIRNAVSNSTMTIILDTFMAATCGALLFYISNILFFITVAVMVIYAVIIFLFKNSIRNINHIYMEDDSKVNSYMKESVDGIQTIKAFRFERKAKEKIKILVNNFANHTAKGQMIYGVQDSLVELISSLGTVILMWSGTYMCISNVITLADLFTFYYLISYFLDPMKNLINLQPELQTAMVAAERLNDILEAEPEDSRNKKIDFENGDINISNVDFRYGNRELVLSDINMKISKGKKVAIVGESGCGKTTLSKLLLSFYEPEKGIITINGKNIYDISLDELRKHIAYISQDTFMFADTVMNNLTMGDNSITKDEVKRICHMCQASEFIEEMPLEYDTFIEENGDNLSGGQKQRLAIARALLRKPDILIMDEATANLDTITEEHLQEAFDELTKNTTCIVIAHKLKTIRNCDYIYVLRKGHIIEEGTHNELIIKNGEYKKYFDNM